MGKRDLTNKLAWFFLISFLTVSIGCEIPWNNVTNSDTTNAGGNTGNTGGTGGTNGSSRDFIIPAKSIIIDGNNNDWNDIDPVFKDNVNDKNPNANFNATDINKFYLAKDDIFLYVMITLYDGYPKTDIATLYVFQANQSAIEADSPGDRFTKVFFTNGQWHVDINERLKPDNSTLPVTTVVYHSEYAGIGSNFIEWKVRLADMGTLNGRYVRVYTHAVGIPGYPPQFPVSDENITNIRLIDK